MKRKIIFAFLIGLSLSLFGQEKGRITLHPILEYGYNYTHLNYGCIGIVSDFQLADNFSINGGLQANTANIYSISAKGTVGIPLKIGKLYIENRYLYKIIQRINFQEMNAAISLGYAAKYWKIQAGFNTKFYGLMNESNNNSIIFEPFNVLYLLEGTVFKPDHIWNIGGRVSNFDHFIMERFGNPIFTVFGHYTISEKIKLVTETGVRPSGITNINANFWGYYLQIGMLILW